MAQRESVRERMDVPALVLAGGRGTRLRSVMADRPKVLAPVGGRPFLSHLLDQLQAAGVRQVVLCTGHLAEQVESEYGPRHGQLALTYSRDERPLGTGGALRQALAAVSGDLFLVLNGDSYTACQLPEFLSWHRRRGFPASLVVTWVADVSRFGTVAVDAAGAVRAFHEKRGLAEPGWINAGVYLLSRQRLESLPIGTAVSLEQDAFPTWLASGLGGFPVRAPFLDIGTPESFVQAEAFLAAVSTKHQGDNGPCHPGPASG